ncbi:hypothetical protein D3273_25775 [Lichenibacterium minor]|uniref:Uncharacterized protein n=1 Tax=Lichenibacterium minor TaxID=2316528 RepID=A0A4Q2U0D2_9HYPH|nr:hypothetical protein [Lichenibacterium minor]RYC29088.1 hypothetical protein D3273_25775 [Lichenibacterium minor]
MHDHEVPGAPVRILAMEEGDEAHVPHEVEDGLRSQRDLARDDRETDAVLRDLELREVYAAGRRDALRERDVPLRLVHSGEPVGPPPTRPTVVALAACVIVLLVVECLLTALRVGGAVAWDWGWVLAPLWVPTAAGTSPSCSWASSWRPWTSATRLAGGARERRARD